MLPSGIAPTSDGGILLEWSSEQTDLEVENSDVGHLSYVKTARNVDGEQYDEREDASIPEVVNAIVSTIGS